MISSRSCSDDNASITTTISSTYSLNNDRTFPRIPSLSSSISFSDRRIEKYSETQKAQRNWQPVAAPNRYECQLWASSNTCSSGGSSSTRSSPAALILPSPDFCSNNSVNNVDHCDRGDNVDICDKRQTKYSSAASRWTAISPPTHADQRWKSTESSNFAASLGFMTEENNWFPALIAENENPLANSYQPNYHYQPSSDDPFSVREPLKTKYRSDYSIYNSNSGDNNSITSNINQNPNSSNGPDLWAIQNQYRRADDNSTVGNKHGTRGECPKQHHQQHDKPWKQTPRPALLCGWQNGATEADRNFARFTLQ